jgi:hypothetical protein
MSQAIEGEMKMKQLNVLLNLSIVLILAVSQQTAAQYRDSLGTTFSNPMGSMMSTMIWNKINEAALGGAQRGRSPGASRGTARPDVVPAYRIYPPVRFKPTGTRLKLQELSDQLGKTAEEKAEMKRLLGGILDKYDASAAAKGYPGDLALAMVSYIGLNSRVFNQRTEEMMLPFEQNIGLRDTLAETAVNNGIFSNLTDTQKQEIYEGLVMIAGITHHLYEDARKKNNLEELKDSKLLAEQNLKNIGINP